LRAGREHPSSGSTSIIKGQRQTMAHVQLDSKQERFVLASLEETNINVRLPSERCCAHPVHSIDDLHRRAMHNNRWERRGCICEYLNVCRVFTREPRREPAAESADGHPSDT
jgi:hypothetical protein